MAQQVFLLGSRTGWIKSWCCAETSRSPPNSLSRLIATMREAFISW